MFLSILLDCSAICHAHFYAAGFSHEDKSLCYCADIVSKSDPIPFTLTISLPEVEEEEPSKPNWDLE